MTINDRVRGAAQTAAPRSARSVLIAAVAVLIVVGLVAWLVCELRRRSRRSSSRSCVVGLHNGALYALVALGYTLVYGIIELINFAHGDLFMLGTMFSAFIMVNWLRRRPARRSLGWASSCSPRRVPWRSARRSTSAIEFFAYRRLRRAPKLAPLITAVGMSFILQNIGLHWNGSTPAASGPACSRTGGITHRRRH